MTTPPALDAASPGIPDRPIVLSENGRTVVVSPDTLRGGGDRVARTPPGQTLTRKWPVLQAGDPITVDPATWELRVWGACANPFTLDWAAFNELATVDVICDIHCVTRWSRLDNRFTGVPTRTIIEMARPSPEARFVLQHAPSYPKNDWTTNASIEEFTADDCMLATHHDGEPLTPEHGYPVRAIVPRLYFWKGAKWITGIEIRETDAPGYWEVNGYHMHGDPWREERYGR